jgi:hypothetical protein
VDAAKKEKNQLIQESEEAKAKLRNELDLLKQRMDQLVDEGADKQEKIERLEAKRNELIAQVWSSYHRVLICIFLRIQAVFRIDEILVRIRNQILGSIPLTNGSGSEPASCYFRQ